MLVDVGKRGSPFGAPASASPTSSSAEGTRSLPLQIYLPKDGSHIFLSFYEVFPKELGACPSTKDWLVLEEQAMYP